MSWHFLFAKVSAATLSDLPSQLSLPEGSRAQTRKLGEARGCQTLKLSSPQRVPFSTGDPETLPTYRLCTASSGILPSGH